MEPDVSVETSAMIRVAIVPVGEVPAGTLREYYGMFAQHERIPLSAISSFYTQHQKSPFSQQPWEWRSLRLKFLLGGAPPSPWEDYQSNRKTPAQIGLCHCPSSPDLDSALRLLESSSRSFPSALVHRRFACDSQLEDAGKKGYKLRLFPPGEKQKQEIHLQTMMQDIAASLLMEFEKWVLQAESTGTILKTPLDSQASLSSEEVIQAKRRRLARAQKTIGDYCLLAGSPIDANAHYSTSLELARLNGDFFWYAGALEGSVCALLIDRTGTTDPGLEDEVKSRYNNVVLHYRKSFIQENAQRSRYALVEENLTFSRSFSSSSTLRSKVEVDRSPSSALVSPGSRAHRRSSLLSTSRRETASPAPPSHQVRLLAPVLLSVTSAVSVSHFSS